MKKLFYLFVAACFALVGCSDDNENPKSPEQQDGQFTQEQIDSIQQAMLSSNIDVNAELVKEEHLSKQEMADFLFGADGANGDEEAMEYRKKFLERCGEIEDSLANVKGQNAFTLIFNKSNFNYETVDENGNKITLSAFMGYGEYISFDGYTPLDQDYYYFCCPYTHTLESECATESKGGFEFTLLMGDNLFVMPDGQGFGKDKNHDQTYLNHELHARQYFDALQAGYKIYKSKGSFEGDWKLRVVGASQGAGDAIALHKYLDTHTTTLDLSSYGSLLSTLLCIKYGVPIGTKSIEMSSSEFYNFEYSYVCCGPYCPEATMKTYYDWKGVSYPCVIPLVIKSMLKSYKSLSNKYKESDFYSDLWNKNKSNFDKIYLEKSKNTDDLNVYIREKLKIGDEDIAPETVPLDRILSKTILDTNSQMCKDFMECLRKQDLTSGWTPKTKCYIYYSKKDEVVPYVNTEKLRNFMGSKCSSEEAFWDGHVACCKQFMLKPW